MEHNNGPDTDNIEATINDTNLPSADQYVRDTSPINVTDIDSNNLSHIENESSPDLVKDFVSKLDAMVASSDLQERLNHNLDDVKDYNNNQTVPEEVSVMLNSSKISDNNKDNDNDDDANVKNTNILIKD